MTPEMQNKLRRNLAKNAVAIIGDSRPVTEPKIKINNGPALAASGLGIVHVNHRDDGSGDRSMTIAFKQTGNLVEIATSIVHPQDTFNKKIGTSKAIEAFNAGKVIRLPIPNMWRKGSTVSHFVKTFFQMV